MRGAKEKARTLIIKFPGGWLTVNQYDNGIAVQLRTGRRSEQVHCYEIDYTKTASATAAMKRTLKHLQSQKMHGDPV